MSYTTGLPNASHPAISIKKPTFFFHAHGGESFQLLSMSDLKGQGEKGCGCGFSLAVVSRIYFFGICTSEIRWIINLMPTIISDLYIFPLTHTPTSTPQI